MRTLTFAALILLVLVAACAPISPAPNLEEVPNPTLTPKELFTPIPTATQEQVTATPVPSATAIPATATVAPTATVLPTATATPMPVVFDRTGYRQFAVMRSFFPGYADDPEERSRSVIRHALSPDGSLLAISGCWGSTDNFGKCESADSGLLVVLDTNHGERIAEIPVGDSWPGGVAFTEDGRNLLYGTTGQKVALWDLSDNAPGITFFAQPQSARLSFPAVAAAPDSTSYAAVIEKTLYVWDSSGKLLLQTPASQVRTAYGALRYSADGSRLVVFSPDGTGVDVYKTADWSLARRFQMANIVDAAISPDGRVLAGIEMEDDSGIVWDVETGEQLAELDPGFQVSFIQFNPTSDLLIITGPGNLDTRDSYSSIGTIYETQGWTLVENFYSFSSPGQVEFSSDGSRMAMFDGALTSIWMVQDAQLLAGFETVQLFQKALATGDYAAAAQLFMVDEREADYLLEMGVDLNDLAGSFERLCSSQTIFCYPVQEMVMMGYSFDYLTYLVRLTDPDGQAFTTPEGAQIIYFYLMPGEDGKPRLIYLPQD